MARRLAVAAVAVAVLALALASGAASQAPAPAPSADCSKAVAGLALCLSYVTPGSTQGKPTKECCAGVKVSVKNPAAVACLCGAFSQVPAGTVNLTRAAGLPAACGEDPATFSKCNIKLPGAPTEAPAPASASTPAASSPGKSAAARSPASAFAVVAAVAAPLLSYYYL